MKNYAKKKTGNDKRAIAIGEAIVIFSPVFATALSGCMGCMVGLFLKEREGLFFSLQIRDENKKILKYFSIVIRQFIVLWTSSRLIFLMGVAFGIGI